MVQWPDAAGSPRNRGDPAGGREPAAALPVQYVNRPNLDFRGFSGTVASGTVQVPASEGAAVGRRIERGAYRHLRRRPAEAAAGEAITLVLKDEIDISRGDLLVDAQASCRRYKAPASTWCGWPNSR